MCCSSAGVQRGCADRCEEDNPCIHGGLCINHYTHTTCDCFNTRYEGQFCEREGAALCYTTKRRENGFFSCTHRVYEFTLNAFVADITSVTLQGGEWISYIIASPSTPTGPGAGAGAGAPSAAGESAPPQDGGAGSWGAAHSPVNKVALEFKVSARRALSCLIV